MYMYIYIQQICIIFSTPWCSVGHVHCTTSYTILLLFFVFFLCVLVDVVGKLTEICVDKLYDIMICPLHAAYIATTRATICHSTSYTYIGSVWKNFFIFTFILQMAYYSMFSTKRKITSTAISEQKKTVSIIHPLRC